MVDFERLKADWLSYEEALALVLDQASTTPAEEVALSGARGQCLATEVRAGATLPPWDNSAMDGFAVRSADVGTGGEVTLPVAGHAYPGSVPLEDVPSGAAVRIMTGGPLPRGFDSVIRVEHTDGEERAGWVTLHRLEDVGKHVRPSGQDMVKGDVTVPVGTSIHSGSVPVILASGRARVAVYRRPRVGILSSGDELVDVDRFDRVVDGRGIPDTNRHMIAASVSEAGARPVDLGVVPDDPDALSTRLDTLGDVDVLVTTGGASMGERDLFKRVLSEFSFRLGFWRARIRPGSPVSFGHLPREGRDIPTFGLPGNPASAFVTFHVLVKPFLRATLGSHSPVPLTLRAHTDDALASPTRLTQFFRVRLAAGAPGGAPQCSLTGPQGSGLVRSLLSADGLAVVPEGAGRIEAGELVSVLPLSGTR